MINMKKIIVFTNSENLKNEFEIPYIEEDSNLKCLVEKNLISPEYAIHNENGAILINDEENICIMIYNL